MTLDWLPDDTFLQVIAAFGDIEDGAPPFDALKGPRLRLQGPAAAAPPAVRPLVGIAPPARVLKMGSQNWELAVVQVPRSWPMARRAAVRG